MNLIFLNQTEISKWRHYKGALSHVLAMTIKHFNLDEHTSVSCVLVNDEMMHKYNQTYRNKDKTTDVLTFVDDQQEHYLGDVLINVDATVRQAKEYDHTLKRELCFLFAHGLLHTLGYDHHTKEEEQAMIAASKEILHDVVKRRYRSSHTQV